MYLSAIGKAASISYFPKLKIKLAHLLTTEIARMYKKVCYSPQSNIIFPGFPSRNKLKVCFSKFSGNIFQKRLSSGFPAFPG